MSTQVTTMTFFRFKGFSNIFWALKMMKLSHGALKNVKGCSFYKILGSGSGLGFSKKPDWNVFALLQVWDEESHAHSFFENSSIYASYKTRTTEQWTVFSKNISARGAWSGGNPFEKSSSLDASNDMLMVITRATVKKTKLIHFWSQVEKSQQSFVNNPGLIFTKGVGEVPILQMATYSIWDGKKALEHFAKDPKGHGDAARKAIERKWFNEDLFSRFQPYKTIGTWDGVDFERLGVLS